MYGMNSKHTQIHYIANMDGMNNKNKYTMANIYGLNI